MKKHAHPFVLPGLAMIALTLFAPLGTGALACPAGQSPAQAGALNLAAATTADAESPEVKIDNFSFSPQTITVTAGTTVTWTNRDDIPHTVVGSNQEFKSKALDTDDKFSFTFSKPGTYSYFCSLHPKMTGQVVVQ